MAESQEKPAFIWFTESQLVRISGVAHRGEAISQRLVRASTLLFTTDGRVEQGAARRHLRDLAEQYEAMAAECRVLHAEIDDNDLIADDVIADVESLFGNNDKGEE